VSAPPVRRAGPLDPAVATVDVVIPVRNEASHIPACLESVLHQTFEPGRMSVTVIDGDSEDDTVPIVERVGSTRVRILPNPQRSTAAGLNLGIRSGTADVVVRVDGHCHLAPDYVQRCVDLLARTGAGNVGGLMRPKGRGVVGEAMARALCSRFGIGDSRFHFLERQEYVDSVYLGAFRRSVLAETGLYDESLPANEDFELNHRIRQAGYGVLLSPDIRSTYAPRDSLGGIARQFFRYGRGKARVMRTQPGSIQARHLAAPLLVMLLVVSLSGLGAGGVQGAVRRRWLAVPTVYGLCVALAAAMAGRGRPRVTAALMVVFPALHVSWGLGLLSGLAGQSIRGEPAIQDVPTLSAAEEAIG